MAERDKGSRPLLIVLLAAELALFAFVIHQSIRYHKEGIAVITPEQGIIGGMLLLFMYIVYVEVRNRRSLQNIRAEKEKMANVIESLPQGVVVLDPEDKIVSANEIGAALLGADPILCAGDPVAMYFDPAAAQTISGDFTGRLEAGAPKSGKRLKMKVLPLFEQQGRVISLEDIERVTVVAPAAASVAPKARTGFDNLYRMLSELPPSEKVGDALVTARRLANFADQLPVLPPRVERSDADVSALVRRSVEKLGPIVRARKLDVALTAPESRGRVNDDLVSRAIEEVVLNACAYTPAGGKITATVGANETSVTVAIQDNGVGADEADLARVFDPEFTGHVQTPQSAGGRGFGLALAKRVVDAHGGSIVFESRKGQGTRVTFSLPKA